MKEQSYDSLYENYKIVNNEFFGGGLPDNVIITLRNKGVHNLGYFKPGGWKYKGKTVLEISINPTNITENTDEVNSTLVHEICHLAEYVILGKVSHSKSWQEFMRVCGLVPKGRGRSWTQDMTEEFISFSRNKLMPIEVSELTIKKRKRDTSKVKYTCACGNNVWGKEGLEFGCYMCGCTYKENRE